MFFAWNDKDSWLPLIAAATGQRLGCRALAKLLVDLYEGALVFHGCRPVALDSYRKSGLRRSDTESLNTIAREIFLSGQFPELTDEHVHHAIVALGPRDDGRIFACLDRDYLLGYCGHYLIYGSERLCSIAATLSKNGIRDYRQELKKRGMPTLLHVELPWRCVADSDFEQFTSKVSANLRTIKALNDLEQAAFGFEFYDALPSSAIVKFEHPAAIPDPFRNEFPHTHPHTFS